MVSVIPRRGTRYPSIRIRAAGKDTGQRDRRRLRLRDVFGAQLQLRRAALAERLHERAADDFVHERLIAEPDFRFRRVHVHVERVGRHLDEEMHFRTALLDRRLAIRVDDRVRDRAILDDAPVDEDVLRPARRTLLRQRGDEPGELQPARVLFQLQQIAALAVDLIQAIALGQRRRALEHRAARARQREADGGVRERELRDDFRHLRRLRGIRFEKLAACGQVVEQIVDLDERALRGGRLGDAGDRAAVHADLGAALLASRTRAQHEVRHRRDRRQRLAAKSERPDGRQIVGVPDLARRMPFDRQPRIIRLHPFSVVLDADLLLAAELDVNREAPRAGVDRVLDELLDDGGGALDDFAGGNLIREIRGETSDFAHIRSAKASRSFSPESLALLQSRKPSRP